MSAFMADFLMKNKGWKSQTVPLPEVAFGCGAAKAPSVILALVLLEGFTLHLQWGSSSNWEFSHVAKDATKS